VEGRVRSLFWMPQSFEPRVIEGGPHIRVGHDRKASMPDAFDGFCKCRPKNLHVGYWYLHEMRGRALAPRVFLDYH